MSSVTVGRSDSLSCGFSNDRTGRILSDLSHLRSCAWSANMQNKNMPLKCEIKLATIFSTQKLESLLTEKLFLRSLKNSRVFKNDVCWQIKTNIRVMIRAIQSGHVFCITYGTTYMLIDVGAQRQKSMENLQGRSGGVLSSSSVSRAAAESDEKNLGWVTAV